MTAKKYADGSIWYEAFGHRISWSLHALDRLQERFGDLQDMPIPNRKIVNANAKVCIGNKFNVRTNTIVFCCKKDSDTDVAILTVMFRI